MGPLSRRQGNNSFRTIVTEREHNARFNGREIDARVELVGKGKKMDSDHEQATASRFSYERTQHVNSGIGSRENNGHILVKIEPNM